MGCDNEKDDEPGKEKSLKMIKALDVLTNVLPVYDRDANRKEDEGCGENQEIGREKEAKLGDKKVKEQVGVERLKPQIEETPSNCSRSLCHKPRLASFLFQQAQPSEVLDEVRYDFHR